MATWTDALAALADDQPCAAKAATGKAGGQARAGPNRFAGPVSRVEDLAVPVGPAHAP